MFISPKLGRSSLLTPEVTLEERRLEPTAVSHDVPRASLRLKATRRRAGGAPASRRVVSFRETAADLEVEQVRERMSREQGSGTLVNKEGKV